MPIGRQIKIVAVNGASTSGTATAIDSGHSWMFARISTASGAYVKLPSGAEVGDVVEAHKTGGSAALILPPAGESFNGEDTDPVPVGQATVIFRKVSSTEWSTTIAPQ